MKQFNDCSEQEQKALRKAFKAVHGQYSEDELLRRYTTRELGLERGKDGRLYAWYLDMLGWEDADTDDIAEAIVDVETLEEIDPKTDPFDCMEED